MPGPLTPPIGTRFSTGQDLSSLDGPTSAPPGSVTVTAGGTALDTLTTSNPAGTTFYLLAGTHILGGGSPSAFDQVIPKTGNTYIGAPGAVLDGRDTNRYAFTGSASGVTIQYLEVINFACLFDEFVVNHDAGTDWLISHCDFHDNAGAAIGIGIDSIVEYCWLHDNGQYGFSSYKPPVNDGADPAITNVLIDHCEINNNGTFSDEYEADGTPTQRGRNGACKFWDTDGIAVTNNWVHHSNHVAIWADTNNIRMRLENNLIEDNHGEGFFYEISYNFLVTGNTFRRNAIGKGLNWASRSDNFPISAIYISEAGGDAAVAALYAVSVIEYNTFVDNWGDITLWENADRFCNSPANTSHKVWKPLGSVASLAVCNVPQIKVLTVSTVSGSADFTVTGGTFESTDEGRPVSGSGIPVGATILAASIPGNPSGYVSSSAGRLSTPATATASGVTLTMSAGSINVEPGYTACRWHTQNIEIRNNTFDHDAVVVLDGEVLPSGVRSGKISIISNFGTFPSWSPYQGTDIQEAITFDQNNIWHDNVYAGDYSFMALDTGSNLTFAQWQAAPYNQDINSTIDGGSSGGVSNSAIRSLAVSGSFWGNSLGVQSKVVDVFSADKNKIIGRVGA